MTSMPNNIYDLTHSFNSSTPYFPSFPRYCAQPLATVSKDGYEIHKLTFSSHIGTHIDASSHFIQNGLTVDKIPLSTLIGPAVIIDLSDNIQPKQKITWQDIESYESALKPGIIAVICTGWYEKWGTEEYFNHPYLMKEVAEEFVARGIKVVAVDFFGPDETVLDGQSGNGFIFHEVILGAGVIIAENLTNVKPLVGLSNVHVSLLPLKLEGVDGSPIRAIAWQMD
jgi:kynurenine formamidase